MAGARTWTEIGETIEPPPGTTPQCPKCRDYLLESGYSSPEQAQLTLEV